MRGVVVGGWSDGTAATAKILDFGLSLVAEKPKN